LTRNLVKRIHWSVLTTLLFLVKLTQIKNMRLLKNLKQSFLSAISGIKETLVKETSFQIMCFITLLAFFLMFYFPTSRLEKVALLTVCFVVLTLELINSAIERLLDYFNIIFDTKIRIIKDLMAGIVLLVSIGAAIIGWLIFSPYLK